MTATFDSILDRLSQKKMATINQIDTEYQNGMNTLLHHKMMMHRKLGSDFFKQSITKSGDDFKNIQFNYGLATMKLEKNYESAVNKLEKEKRRLSKELETNFSKMIVKHSNRNNINNINNHSNQNIIDLTADSIEKEGTDNKQYCNNNNNNNSNCINNNNIYNTNNYSTNNCFMNNNIMNNGNSYSNAAYRNNSNVNISPQRTRMMTNPFVSSITPNIGYNTNQSITNSSSPYSSISPPSSSSPSMGIAPSMGIGIGINNNNALHSSLPFNAALMPKLNFSQCTSKDDRNVSPVSLTTASLSNDPVNSSLSNDPVNSSNSVPPALEFPPALDIPPVLNGPIIEYYDKDLNVVLTTTQDTALSESDINMNRQHDLKGYNYFKCLSCLQAFNDETIFTQHTNQCSKHYKTKKGRKKKKYGCNQCNKSFQNLKALMNHVSCHKRGEKPYKCQHCNKSFTQNKHLLKHKRIHNGEKPYKCNHCEKRFTSSTRLNKHYTKRHSK